MKKIEEGLPPDLLLMRNNATIKEIKITQEQIEEIKGFGAFGQKYYSHLRRVLGVGACSGCRNIPDYEICSEVGDDEQKVTKIEYFCSACARLILQREKQEKESSGGLEEIYHFKKVDKLPVSYNEP